MTDRREAFDLAKAVLDSEHGLELRQSRTVDIRHQRSNWWVRVWRRLARAAGAIRWRRCLAAFGRGSSIRRPLLVTGGRAIAIGSHVTIWPGARLEAINLKPGIRRIDIGSGTVIHPNVHIGAIDSVRIGRGVLVAGHVYITDHDHDWSNPDEPVVTNRRAIAAPVEIGDFAWIGERAMVLKGVRIGAGAVVGAGSVVTRDVPARSIVVGAPARVVKTYDERQRRWRSVAA